MTRAPIRRLVAAFAALLAILLAGGVAGAGSAAAHAELVSVSPPDGGAVGNVPQRVELRFSEPVTTPAAVSVIGPSGRELAAGDPATLGTLLTQPLAGTTDAAGAYTMRYQVMSVDGHLVSGATTFSVAGGGSSSNAPAAPARAGPTGPLVLFLGLSLPLMLVLTAVGLGRLARAPVDG